jgi:predicted nucleic acid-binding protein
MKTLVNTTVLSNFAAVGRLDLLKQLQGRLYLPNEVYEEILNGLEEGYGFYTGIEENVLPFAEGGWIELVSMVAEEELRLFQSLPRRLHHGEAACLAIARHRNWALLTDDMLARKMAQDLGIVVSGTLGVLVQAVRREVLMAEEGDILLRAMIARGYRSPHSSLQPLLGNG